MPTCEKRQKQHEISVKISSIRVVYVMWRYLCVRFFALIPVHVENIVFLPVYTMTTAIGTDWN